MNDMSPENKLLHDVALVNWDTWTPQEKAVLCIIRKQENILLIHKKTGLGTGKVNFPGGRIEANEIPINAAIRECQEEVGLTPGDLVRRAELHFIFTDGYSLHGEVFTADSHSGTPIETREADPFWCEIRKIPFTKMWADDVHWVPLVLTGVYVKAYFIFDGDTMLSMRVDRFLDL